MKIVITLFLAFNLFADDGGGVGGGGGPQMKAWEFALKTVSELDVKELHFEDGRVASWEEVTHVEYFSSWVPKEVEYIDWIELNDSEIYYQEEIEEVQYHPLLKLSLEL